MFLFGWLCMLRRILSLLVKLQTIYGGLRWADSTIKYAGPTHMWEKSGREVVGRNVYVALLINYFLLPFSGENDDSSGISKHSTCWIGDRNSHCSVSRQRKSTYLYGCCMCSSHHSYVCSTPRSYGNPFHRSVLSFLFLSFFLFFFYIQF